MKYIYTFGDQNFQMKKLYTLLLFVITVFITDAQVINFPDTNLKARLLLADADSPNWWAKNLSGDYFKIDANNNGEIEQSEASQVSDLNLSNSEILSTEGLQHFINTQFLNISYVPIIALDLTILPNLRELMCTNNDALTSLNLTGLIHLEKIWCFDDQLITLDLSTLTSLIEINCTRNHLTLINTTGITNLRVLVCGDNMLTNLNVDNLTLLTHLYCEINLLTSLNLSNLNNMVALNCNDNQLTSVDVSNMDLLESLSCQNNQLTLLVLNNSSQNFHYLGCYDNQLTSLNLDDLPQLLTVYCQNNLLTSLEINNSPYLQYLICDHNQLTTLDLSNCTLYLQILECQNNNLSTLFIKNNYTEYTLDFSNNPNLEYICADAFQFSTIQNKIAQYGYTNCNVNDYCSFTPGGTFYTIQGASRYDENNNGCDINDNNIQFPKYSLSDGTQTGNLIGDVQGNFRYDVQAGTHTVAPVMENPSYFSVSPTSITVTFPNESSPFSQIFCISANGVHNDLEVFLIPTNVARPGFDAIYNIVYKNKGTHTQSGNVNLEFNDGILDYVIANPSANGQLTNNLTWDFTNLLPLESRQIAVTLNINAPTETPAVNNGDVLNYTATITGTTDENVNDNTSILNQAVVNSIDPNDKTCIEGTIVSPSMVGQYVHYIIRFENTGTFAAENIVVKDIIDTNKFDINSLIPISSSHSFITRVTASDKVEFIFENINLPFDDANNDGYVAFKLKTKPTLVVGDSFSNSASIFFDYNFPIITNTFTTTIQALNTQDFDFGTYFSVYPNPAKELLNLENRTTIEVKSITIYNLVGQIVIAIPNAESVSTIDVSDLKTGTYFIKVNTDKGMANSMFIKE